MALLSAAPLAGSYSSRKWAELRDVHVPPSRISSPPLSIIGAAGLGGLFNKLGFDMNWLRIEGIDDPALLNSNNFEYKPLEDPHEWAANLSPAHKVTLKVGRTCQCEMTGLALYSKQDQTAWMRLQFESCRGCESTAQRSAVVIPLAPQPGAQSNLVTWMCDLFPHGACQPSRLPPAVQPAVATKASAAGGLATATAPTTTSRTMTATTTRTETTTTREPRPRIVETDHKSASLASKMECDFTSVRLSLSDLGPGTCIGQPLDSRAKVKDETDCLVACELLYLERQLAYGNVDALNRNLDAINRDNTVCRGYAYNKKDELCTVYTGREAIDKANASTADARSFVCVGKIRAEQYVLHKDTTSPQCTTTAPESTTTVTSITRTTSTTITGTTMTRTTTRTSTTVIQPLNLLSAFGDLDVRQDVGVFSFPDAVHFHKEARDATMMQLQSPCFEDVDYYLLSSKLPIEEAEWPRLMEVLSGFGTEAVGAGYGSCPASATVDRLPVEVDFGRGPGIVQRLSVAGALGSVCLYVAAAVALVLRCAVWARQVGESDVPKSPHEYFTHYVAAVFAAVACSAAVYSLGLLACWFNDRAGHKQLAASGGGGLLTLSPTLFSYCLPMAGTTAGVVFSTWVWPRLHGTPVYNGYREGFHALGTHDFGSQRDEEGQRLPRNRDPFS